MKRVQLVDIGEGGTFRTLITNAEGTVLEHVESTTEDPLPVFVKVSLLYPGGRRVDRFLHPRVEVGVTE